MKTLNEIRDQTITSAVKIHSNIYVYAGTNVIFIIPGDSIMVVSPTMITVTLGKTLVTYDSSGKQTSIVPL